MAQINAIVTEGFGSFAGVQYIVTMGFLGGTTPPVVVGKDTHDYPVISDRDLKKHRAKLKRDEEAREAKLKAKIAEREAIRAEIENVINPQEVSQGTAVELAADIKPSYLPPPPSVDLQKLLAQLSAEITSLHDEQDAAVRSFRRARDEIDMQVILALLNKPTLQ